MLKEFGVEQRQIDLSLTMTWATIPVLSLYTCRSLYTDHRLHSSYRLNGFWGIPNQRYGQHRESAWRLMGSCLLWSIKGHTHVIMKSSSDFCIKLNYKLISLQIFANSYLQNQLCAILYIVGVYPTMEVCLSNHGGTTSMIQLTFQSYMYLYM